MSLTGMLRSSLPSTSKSANSPRVSSPLATHSSSVTSGEEDHDDDEDSEDDSSSDAEDDPNGTNMRESDDSDVELGQWLARAKENARRRAAATSAHDTSADSASAAAAMGGSSIAGPSVNLGDFDLAAMDEDEEQEKRLPAVYTRHADPAQVFNTDPPSTTSTTSKNKGKGRAIPSADNLDDEEHGEILPGIKSKWGELPFVRKSKKVLKAEKSKTAGRDWFDLPRRPAASLSNEEKRELQAMRLSNVMDPKKFMRGESKRDNKKLPEFFQTGYIIESGQGPRAGLAAPSDKIKKQSFLGHVLADDRGKEWSKRKYLQLQEKASSGGKGFYKKKMRDRKSVNGGKRKHKGART